MCNSIETKFLERIYTTALCQNCGHSYLKVPNFDKLFLCVFSSRVSKICVELCELLKNLENWEEQNWKRKIEKVSVCKGQNCSQKVSFDKCNNTCSLHFSQTPPIANIARGTTDPGYWVQNLNKLFQPKLFQINIVRNMIQVIDSIPWVRCASGNV